jgi:hypothetical protein
MHISRRNFLKVAALFSGSLAISGCAPLYNRLAGDPPTPPQGDLGDDAGFQMLNRLTFGPRAEERRHLADIGLPAWIEEQLAPAAIEDAPCDMRLRPLDSLTLDADSIYELYGEKLFDGQDRESAPAELRQATLLRQIYSRRQLYEVMVDFWSDHFNISVDKGDCFFLKTVDDRDVIRRHALGNFHDLLLASATSPAMLVYLDNHANDKSHPNENYARELMELHSLGVDGGYTQEDIMELARCLTGWTVKERFWRGQFTFRADMHDDGDKHFMGIPIPGGGMDEAERVIDHLAIHERTAHFLARKLARRFLGDAPPAALIQAAADAFLRSDGEIQAMLRPILLDGLLHAATPKFKRPLNFVVSALRQTNAVTNGGVALQTYLTRMGQLPFAWPTPDGFPDSNADWMNNLLPRWQFALALATNTIPDTRVDLAALTGDLPAAVDRLGDLILGGPLSTDLHNSLMMATRNLPEDERLALLTAGMLAAPAFQWR